MTRRAWLRSAVLLALVSTIACGYSLAGRGSFLPPHIRTIGVPLFTNSTTVPDIDRRVSERIRSELIGRGKYKVLPTVAGADAVIAGEILSISFVPAGNNDQRQATRYQVLLVAKVEFRDARDNRVIWSNPAMQFREDSEISATSADPAAFFGQDANALDRIAAEFARTLVSAILEAF